jgi:hypothetical protein
MNQASRHASTPSPSKLVIGGCVVLSIVGVLVTLGCLLALYLESSGLGAPRDTGMRPGYTTLLIAGAGAGILVPAATCFTLLRTSHRLTIVVAVAMVVIVATAILGIISP